MKKIYFFFVALLLSATIAKSQVVINEVYGGGGNSGATYKNDFIELYNNGNTTVDLSTWSVQYTSATGPTSPTFLWSITNLTGTIQPHGYYLIQQAAGTGGTTALPTPDVIGTIAMGATAGKVALVNNQTSLSGACSTSTAIVDFVGFGTTANCKEGTGPTTAPSNTTSVQRTTPGADTNDNKNDFSAGSPSPTNSGTDITPPSISSLFPANSATNAAIPVTAQIVFNESITKGTGTISVKKLSDGSSVETLNVTDAGVVISGPTALFDINTLDFSTAYYIEVSSGSFKDIAGNAFAGFTTSSTWSFTTSAPIAGILDKTYSFDACSSSPPDGFTQFSTAGAQKWGCTTYGKDALGSAATYVAYALQMNGYASGVNNINEDWLISPSFDLTATTYPLVSFWSRTAYTGASLKLKVSTDYAGSGNPNAATWTDLDGKFPVQLSDAWTLSENINLSAFKASKVYFAFVYTSTTDDGSRWTLDEIMLKNSSTPPPPSLYASVPNIDFPFVQSGANNTKTFKVRAYDLTGDVSLSVTGPFRLSTDNSSFSSSIQLTKDNANNKETTVYLQFSPTSPNQSFSAQISVSTPDAATSVDLNGSSIDPATTLEIVNWNLEWFGSSSLGPTDDNLQEQNIKTVINNLNADMFCLLEVVDENRLKNIVDQMPGYAYKISNFASHTNPFESSPGPLSEAQKLAFVYRTDIFTNVTTTALLSAGVNTAADLSNANYNYWSSGRYPFMLSADVTINCRTEKMKFVLVHAKANTNPLNTSYDRRKSGADELHNYLNSNYPNDKIIILGDYNDDLDASITTGYTTTSWSAFTTDAANFESPTLPLSLAGKKSTVTYKDVIDHVFYSNEMKPYYLPNSAVIASDVSSLVANYGNTTTDHYPVFSRYLFPNNIAPQITACVSKVNLTKSVANNYTIPQLVAVDDCGDNLTYSYEITGGTTRSGTTNNASGNFGIGENVINWKVVDAWGNQSTATTTVNISDQTGGTETWTGSTNSDWETAGNWLSGNLPTISSTVFVPSGLTNYPVISATSAIDCAALYVAAGATLTIQSTEVSSGSLIVHGEATGNIVYNRYLSANHWHLVSPVAFGQPVADFLAANPIIPTKDSYRGMMDYNSNTNSWNTFYPVAGATGTMDAAKGYSMRVATGGTVTFTGSITSGDKSVTLTRSGDNGWNCIGNPYTSAININTTADATSNFIYQNIDKFDESFACIYIWDEDASYSGQNCFKIIGNSGFTLPGKSNLVQNYIAPGQGFFLKAKTEGSSNFTFTSAMQTHTTGLNFKSAALSWPGLVLTAANADTKASAIVTFNDAMTKGLDVSYDAGLLKGTGGLDIYTRLLNDNGVDFAIQCLPELGAEHMVIPVGLNVKKGGEVRLEASFTTLPNGNSVYLEDRVAKTITELGNNKETVVTVPENYSGTGRFYLHMSKSTTTQNEPSIGESLKLKAYLANEKIWIEGRVTSKAVASLFDSRGATLRRCNLEEGDLNCIPASGLNAGVYILKIVDGNQVFTTKLICSNNR